MTSAGLGADDDAGPIALDGGTHRHGTSDNDRTSHNEAFLRNVLAQLHNDGHQTEEENPPAFLVPCNEGDSEVCSAAGSSVPPSQASTWTRAAMRPWHASQTSTMPSNVGAAVDPSYELNHDLTTARAAAVASAVDVAPPPPHGATIGRSTPSNVEMLVALNDVRLASIIDDDSEFDWLNACGKAPPMEDFALPPPAARPQRSTRSTASVHEV